MEERVILGIDPGTNILGYALIKQEGKKVSIINIGILNLKKYTDHYLKLKQIFTSITRLIKQFSPDELAIESQFFGVNVQSMLKLGRAQGVVMAAALNFDIPVTEYAPKKIKLAITGTGTASKEQVALILKKIFKLNNDIKQNDASDALAIALCHYYSLTSKIQLKGNSNNWKDFIKNNPNKIKSK